MSFSHNGVEKLNVQVWALGRMKDWFWSTLAFKPFCLIDRAQERSSPQVHRSRRVNQDRSKRLPGFGLEQVVESDVIQAMGEDVMWLIISRPFFLEFTDFRESTKADFPNLGVWMDSRASMNLLKFFVKWCVCVCVHAVVFSLQKTLSLLTTTKRTVKNRLARLFTLAQTVIDPFLRRGEKVHSLSE